MAKTPNNKILNERNIAFVLGELRGGEKKMSELQKDFSSFCAGATRQNFDMLISALTFKAPVYESDDGYIGLLENK